jgi:hypothetical protein
MTDDDSDGVPEPKTPSSMRAFRSSSRHRKAAPPEGVPVVVVNADSGERVAAAREEGAAAATLEHRLGAIEAWRRDVNRTLMALAVAVLGSLAGVVGKVWTAGGEIQAERARVERAIEDLRDLRDEVRALRRSSGLQPDRADRAIATTRDTP